MSIEIEDYKDNEESYWFIRWVQMRRKYKTANSTFQEITNQNIFKLIEENKSLKSQLLKVKEDYQPKRVYKGRKKL